jgi:hypothetical protein
MWIALVSSSYYDLYERYRYNMAVIENTLWTNQ